jgi:hypothetical protein
LTHCGIGAVVINSGVEGDRARHRPRLTLFCPLRTSASRQPNQLLYFRQRPIFFDDEKRLLSKE